MKNIVLAALLAGTAMSSFVTPAFAAQSSFTCEAGMSVADLEAQIVASNDVHRLRPNGAPVWNTNENNPRVIALTEAGYSAEDIQGIVDGWVAYKEARLAYLSDFDADTHSRVDQELMADCIVDVESANSIAVYMVEGERVVVFPNGKVWYSTWNTLYADMDAFSADTGWGAGDLIDTITPVAADFALYANS